ncbi:LOW QUALITY PROTEIN: jacalin-related lectin 19-like [Argentina anserina]|uniref:LOW QUALITY PROTEIN: jacalin-related lectin 19-like n=1 Tax=Argentina anserina TaxID=57926 RepID=UPI0021768971|nr:LOW QUALITY PROTEIN: jacalin-related lectin 19-like [Potentilla anserina]
MEGSDGGRMPTVRTKKDVGAQIRNLGDFLPSSSSSIKILFSRSYGFDLGFHESGKENSGRKKKTIVLGPWGGNGGNAWDDGLYQGVREVTLIYGHCIDSIVVVYDKNGKPVTSEKHGGLGGNQTAEIKLQYPNEFLVNVRGHYCPVVFGGSPVIRSLKFESNRRTFGPFGVEEGTPFTFTVDGGKIVGLKGRGGWYLDAIGFHVYHAPKIQLFRRVEKSFRRLTSTVWKPSARRETEKTTLR